MLGLRAEVLVSVRDMYDRVGSHVELKLVLQITVVKQSIYRFKNWQIKLMQLRFQHTTAEFVIRIQLNPVRCCPTIGGAGRP